MLTVVTYLEVELNFRPPWHRRMVEIATLSGDAIQIFCDHLGHEREPSPPEHQKIWFEILRERLANSEQNITGPATMKFNVKP